MLSLPVFEHPFSRPLVGALSLLGLPLSAWAVNPDVCAVCEHTTISSAVNSAGPGETVWVGPGDYYESVRLPTGVALRSTGGSGATHLYGTSTNAISVSGGDERLVDGFTIHPWNGTNAPTPEGTRTSAASRGLQISNAVVQLEDVHISAHTSSLSGAAAWLTDASVTVIASSFTGLVAPSGGALDVSRSTLVLLDSELSDNTAAMGGAVHCTNGTLESSYTRYANNHASDPETDALGLGGAISGQRCSVTTSNDQLAQNMAGLGGHIHVTGAALLASQTLFQDGDADTGGAVWFDGTSLGVVGSYFLQNTAVDAAGAVFVAHQQSATHSISGTQFRDNASGGLGGAIRMVADVSGAQLSIADTRFYSNSALTGGGAVSTRGVETLSVQGSSFVLNESTQTISGGGAIRGELAAGLAGSLSVSNSYFCRNSAGAGGALAYNTDDETVELIGSVWVDNSAITAGAFLVDSADFVAEHNDFLDNSGPAAGPVGVLRSGSLAFESNIVTPTPSANGAIFTAGTFSSAYSDYNLWWSNVEQTFGGEVQSRNVNGDDEQEGDALLFGYDPTLDCLDWEFSPGFESPVFDSPGGVIGVTGGDIGPSAFNDLDGDGIARPMDCDDTNLRIYPGAPEACNGVDNDCNGIIDDIDPTATPANAQIYYYDADNDGFGGSTSASSCRQASRWVTRGTDCDDADRATSPGAAEIWYDGFDQNCDGLNDFDQDGDGYEKWSPTGAILDCNDTNAAIHPDATEIWYDGTDQNCDGANDFDQDRDGSALNDPIPDCDDQDDTRSPAFDEQWYDGIDQDCMGGDDYDQDRDGQQLDDFGGEDCDDEDATIFVGADEIWYDGVNQNCDDASDFDQDGDGFTANLPLAPGDVDDCDDLDDSIFPGQAEIPNDGVDQDCDGMDSLDADGDGYAPIAEGGLDCDDGDASINPGADEVPYDGIDQDCSGSDLTDVDGDGFTATEAGGDDCDDTDSEVYPDAHEVWYDGVDQDCDGASDFDQDGDLWLAEAGDCDDTDPERHPGAIEQANSDVDLNCDGYVPVSRVTGAGCSSVPVNSGYLGLLAGLLAVGLRRRR